MSRSSSLSNLVRSKPSSLNENVVAKLIRYIKQYQMARSSFGAKGKLGSCGFEKR